MQNYDHGSAYGTQIDVAYDCVCVQYSTIVSDVTKEAGPQACYKEGLSSLN